MNALGFKDDGTVDKSDYPIQAADGTLFQGEFYDVAFYGKWMRLHDEIARHGFRQVCEEGAYTWFNRLMAIQILAKNGLISPVLEFESSDVRIPLLVEQAHEGICPDMSGLDASRLKAIIADDNRITDQFAILIVAFCQSTPILYKCFGTLNDFTELLLPTNILASNGFLSLLNGSSFITAHDYESTELIGWLYQFYIAERKDEVFASFKSGHKAEADDLPAATQIFTPNWIVKYMVQNTLGRIYLDNNPGSPLKDEWKYLIDTPRVLSGAEAPLSTSSLSTSPLSTSPLSTSSLSTSPLPTLPLPTLENLTFADLSCGSGHILNEAFDVLFAIYKEEGYTRRQAIKAIFEHNITGVDIDTRARQLATFALMLKACQQWPDAIGCEVMPRVLDMPAPDDPVCDRYPILRQAHNLGSIMKIEPLPGETHPLVLALTQKYAAIAMNPPYMGGGNMNANLAKYVKDNYEDGKNDLCTVFMMMQAERTIEGGFYANIVPPSWMFLSTFESLRKHIIDSQSIQSVLHLSRGVFGADFGSVSCVIQNTKNENAKATYFRLVERTFQEFDQRHLQLLFEKTLANHNFRFFFANYTKEVNDIVYSEKGTKIYYPNVSQSNFKKIPGCPLGYWVSNSIYKAFEQEKVEAHCKPKKGVDSPPNDYFLKMWFEVDYSSIGFNCITKEAFLKGENTWVPVTKGGRFRKWFGNNDYVLLWKNNGEEVKNNEKANVRNEQFFFSKSLTWTDLSSGVPSFRYNECGFIPNVAGPCVFDIDDNYAYIISLLNSKPVEIILKITAPTMHFNVGAISSLPYFECIEKDRIELLSKENISLSKSDWDAHETSWDFRENELVRYAKGCTDDGEGLPPRSRVSRNPENGGISLEDCLNAYKHDWEQRFGQLHANEEELNRQFIEIYGLQDELTPDVPLDEITILQQGEISIEE